MKKYRVAQSSDYKKFVDDVNEALANGWLLQGGVSVRTNKDGYPVYYQALTKEVVE
jgi:hypothetical protein